jgi:hypothetical protein
MELFRNSGTPVYCGIYFFENKGDGIFLRFPNVLDNVLFCKFWDIL